MGEQVEKSFTWKLKNFSTLPDECYYSPPFVFAGLNWHIFAYPKYKGHLSVYVGLVTPESLPSGWGREVEFCLSVLNNNSINDTKVLCGQTWFDASTHSWGFREFLPSSKLGSRDDGFLVGDSLIIVADLHVFPLIAEPQETVRIIEHLSNKLGIQAANASLNRSQEDSSCQLVQRTENDASQENVDYDVSIKNPCVSTSQVVLDDDDASQEGSDDDGDVDDASEEGSDDDDASEEGSDDDDASEEGSDDDDDDDDGSSEEGSDDDDGSSEEGSDDDDGSSEEGSDDDDGSSEEGSDDDDALSPVSHDGGLDKKSILEIWMCHVNKIPNQAGAQGDSSCQIVKRSEDEASLKNVDYDVSEKNTCVDTSQEVSDDADASQEVLNDVDGASEKGSDDEDASKEDSDDDDVPEEETMDVNGFQVFASQVESVSHIFKRHPDIALGFRPKNLQIRRALMSELLSLIELLCQSPEKLSEDDLRNADETLVDLIDVGFKLDWLKIKLNEVSEKKKRDQNSRARLQTMEAQLQKLKLMFLDLDSQLRKEKTEALAARAPLSFNDVVS